MKLTKYITWFHDMITIIEDRFKICKKENTRDSRLDPTPITDFKNY